MIAEIEAIADFQLPIVDLNLDNKQCSVLGCPVEQKPLNRIPESSSVGARPSSAAPVENYPGK